MFRRFNFLIVFILIFSGSCFSQLEKDPKASEILKGVSEKYKSYKSVSSDFRIIIDDQKTKTKNTQAANIAIKGNMYKLTLSDQEVISDGKTVWTFLKEANEVQINDAGAKSGAITPGSIFTIYESGFGTKYTGEKTIDGKIYQVIDLVPEDTKKSFFKIQLNINKTDKQVSNAKVFQKNGTFLIYTIDKLKANSVMSDTLFTFQKDRHPGVELIDLR